MSLLRRRMMMSEYIRNDANEELDYFTLIPYTFNEEDKESGVDIYAYGYFIAEGATVFAESEIYYSINGGEWTLADYEIPFKVKHLDRIRFKGYGYDVAKIAELYEANSDIYYNTSPIWVDDNSTYEFMAEGTPLSLLHGDNFKERKNDLPAACFYQMFNMPSLVQINNPRTFLPSTELSRYCYQCMFAECGIINAPILPAEILAEGCYCEMFYRCSFLEKAPDLNAKTLAPYCYYYMFKQCGVLRYTKLTTTGGFDAEGACDSMYESTYKYGVCVLSQELIDLSFHEAFFSSDWTAVNEEYPTNDEGYPDTDYFDYETELLLLNTKFISQNDEGLSYRRREADDISRFLYEAFKMNSEPGDGWSFPSGQLFVDMLSVYYVSIGEDHVVFSAYNKNTQAAYIILWSDGTIECEYYEYLIWDYVQV